MKKQINPEKTSRALAYKMWMSSPMPMVTVFKTIDVTKIVRTSQRLKVSLNMLLCYCIGKAASRVPEFRMLPENGEMMQFDGIGVNVIVKNVNGGICSCDVPFVEDIGLFSRSYHELTKLAASTGENVCDENLMIIGTSALPTFEFDGVVNQYSGVFNNPFMVWGKYNVHWFRKYLKLSFQFHHVQMDGEQACLFLKYMQEEVRQVNSVIKKDVLFC